MSVQGDTKRLEIDCLLFASSMRPQFIGHTMCHFMMDQTHPDEIDKALASLVKAGYLEVKSASSGPTYRIVDKGLRYIDKFVAQGLTRKYR